MNTIDDVRNYFKNDLFATEATGAIIEDAKPGYAKISCPILPKHKNARGAVMGGVYLTLADFACGVAANFNIGEEPPCVSMTSQMNFLSAAKGEVLYAEARAIKTGRNMVYLQVEVTDDLGTLIATSSAANYRLK